MTSPSPIGAHMDIRPTVLALCLLFAAPLFGREKTDVIVMRNGDRLTCEVKGLSAGVLYISLDYVDGTISVEWSEVARVESTQLFIVRTEGGFVYSGTLSTADSSSGKPVKIQVAETEGEKVEIERSRIVEMGETSDSFWGRFEGDISAGILYSKGNQSTQYNVSSEVEYPRDRWQALANINSSLSSSTGVAASARNQANFSVLRLLRWNNTFYAGSGGFLQSSEQGIDLQSHLGGGIGHYLKNTNRTMISLLGGVAWQNTNYVSSEPQDVENVAAALISANVKIFKFKKTNLNVTADLLPAISEPGRVFFSTNATYYLKIASNLSWNLSFYGNWDNRPPADLPGSDYGTSSGLSWTFGNR
jgi:Protein of unknown function, DUF481